MEERIKHTEKQKETYRHNLNTYSREDIIEFLLDTREQRDNYKELVFEFKGAYFK